MPLRAAPPSPAPAPPPEFAGHVPALDGLRGVAILMVMVFHFFRLGGGEPVHVVDRAVGSVVALGWSGVDLFFVLSGFLITGILYDTRHRDGFFRTFYVRRFLRIFPLYYGFLILSFYLLPMAAPFRDTLEVDATTRLSMWTYLLNIRIGLAGWEVVPQYLVPFWTLAIEEQFYLAWPVLVFALSRRALLRACGAMVAVSIVSRVWLQTHGVEDTAQVFTISRLDGLAVGAALALLVRDPQDHRTVLRWARPALLVAGLTTVGMRIWSGGVAELATGAIGFSLIAVAFGATLILAISSSGMAPLARVCCSAPLRFFGKYSYALYVFHVAVALPLTALGITAATLSPVAGTVLPGQLAFTALGTALSTVAALLSWQLYEKRFLRLKDRFTYGAADRSLAPEVVVIGRVLPG